MLIYQVDAFTDRPFAGNPAAVCLLAGPADETWMRHVAREMNLSETAFLHPLSPGANDFQLRWFTPTVEVDLCGHATLATAHILWETGVLAEDVEARFHTRSGLLTARRLDGWIELNFPATPPEPCPAPDGLAAALGVEPLSVGRSKFDYLVEVDSTAAVTALEPDFTRLRSLPVRGIIVTAANDGGLDEPFDFVSRFFAPAAGVDEDPVTGSAHCTLAPFWAARLGKPKMTAYQASARGGVVRVELLGDRVALQGQAVTVLRAELLAV